MTDQTPNNDVPTEPTHPGAAVPPKKGLPGWAIGLIIGGGLLLIAIIVGAIVVASLFTNAIKQETSNTPDGGPSTPPTASVEPTTTPSPPANTTGALALDDSATFGSPPVWGAPYLTGWDITVLDQEGINRFENKALGCTFTTSQNVQNVDSSSPSDAPSTQDLVDTLKGQIVDSAPGAVVVPTETVDLSMGVAGSSSTIEFATLRLDYSLQSGDYASVLFARSMPQAGSYMYTFLECPLAALDGADSPLQALTDGLAVVPGS